MEVADYLDDPDDVVDEAAGAAAVHDHRRPFWISQRNAAEAQIAHRNTARTVLSSSARAPQLDPMFGLKRGAPMRAPLPRSACGVRGGAWTIADDGLTRYEPLDWS